ncbi:MAG: hypothetical protein M1830_002299 [Pleopsidium flavum]|nr:MAG: hypothetical protein M1830_002299 [Pleopsidium flavum]
MCVNPDSKEAGGLSDYEVGVEVSNSIIAATNATGITLTYIFWELACHPEWQDKLREEFKGVETDSVGREGAVWYKDIATLPVLNAVVNEVMRKIPAFPASLPRMPSAGGAVIDGVFVPANVIVSAQCYTLHRHSVTFPSPDSFSPDRWLDTHNGTDTMRDLFVPFSRGLRNCMGQNLALMELKIVTAAVLKRYTVSVGKAMRGDEMEMRDHFVLMPKAGRCELVFESVRKT